ncbi:MAG TPA: hypothetical protein VF722_03925 [Gemmatimonadaceae bacterium]
MPDRRRSYRPPNGVPMGRSPRWGVVPSVLLHLVIILLLLSPALEKHLIDDMPTGAGGLTAAGGGGGGRRGAALPEERLHFVQTAPARPAAPPVPQPVLEKPRVAPPPVKPPEPIATPEVRAAVTAPAPMALAAAPGTGMGNDSSAGAGPGTGGGTGTGVGTGRGSAAGPGTGGGTGTVYPATPDFLVIPALPVPKKLHGHTISVRFTLDEKGQVLKVESDPSGDDGYDKQLRARLAEYRFRPAHRMDGTPVPSVYITQLTL